MFDELLWIEKEAAAAPCKKDCSPGSYHKTSELDIYRKYVKDNNAV
jgi:hypothetical protein